MATLVKRWRPAVAVAGSGTRGLGWRESVGQPLGCPEGGLGIDGAVRLQGEWVNRPLLTLRFPALSLWPRLRPQQSATHWAMPSC